MMPQVLAGEGTDVMPIPVKELLQKQAKDPFWKQAAKKAERLGLQYNHDRYGFLVQN